MIEATGLEAPIRVMIVDDHDVVHWGFRLMLSDLPWVERSLSARSRSEVEKRGLSCVSCVKRH